MSLKEKGVAMDTATSPIPAVAGTPSHAEVAQGRILELGRWREPIPNFVIPETADATQKLSSAASVPAPFIELSNVALANQPVLVRQEGATPAQIRDLVAFSDAYNPLADELEALAHFIRHSAVTARNIAGFEALTTYSLAKRLAKVPKFARLRPLVADMRRALGRGRKLTPEEAAEKAAERAAKAAAKVARKTPIVQSS